MFDVNEDYLKEALEIMSYEKLTLEERLRIIIEKNLLRGAGKVV